MESKAKQWHIARAKYDALRNAVREVHIKSFETYEEGHAWLLKYQDRAICFFHENCVNLNNMFFAFVGTDAYWNERHKVID